MPRYARLTAEFESMSRYERPRDIARKGRVARIADGQPAGTQRHQRPRSAGQRAYRLRLPVEVELAAGIVQRQHGIGAERAAAELDRPAVDVDGGGGSE